MLKGEKSINSVFTLGYMRGNKEKNQTRFFALVAIAIFGTMGIAASANLITLFIFYEALTISTFPLVTHKGDAKAKRGGTIYALALMGSSLMFLLPAILGTHIVKVVGGLKVKPIFLDLRIAALFYFYFQIVKLGKRFIL